MSALGEGALRFGQSLIALCRGLMPMFDGLDSLTRYQILSGMLPSCNLKVSCTV